MNWKFWNGAQPVEQHPVTREEFDAAMARLSTYSGLSDIERTAIADNITASADNINGLKDGLMNLRRLVADTIANINSAHITAMKTVADVERRLVALENRPKTQPKMQEIGPKSEAVPRVKTHPHLKAARNEEIRRRRREGEDGPALAKAFGLTSARIYQILGKASAEKDAKSPKGRRYSKSVRKAIARELKSGLTKTTVARNYGVSLSTVKRAERLYSDEVKVNPWANDDHVQTLKEIWPDKGWSVADMAKLLGVTENAVRMKARRLQLSPRP
jgi:transposase